MNPLCRYEVQTHWGVFNLDKRAYQDYSAGKLWLTWTPEGQKKITTTSKVPISATKEAITLRDLASKSDAYSICHRFLPTGSVVVPYRTKMSDISIVEMCLSVRSSNGLMRAGANTLGKVRDIMTQEHGLRSIRNLGIKSEREIKIGFFNSCYLLLNEYEKADWFQDVINRNTDAVACIKQGE